MKCTKVQTLGAFYVRRIYVHASITYIRTPNFIARKITRLSAHKYMHAYNCTCADKSAVSKNHSIFATKQF